MARQNINIGSSANDGTGDPLRTAFDKINDNFIELFGADDDSNTLAGNLDVNGHNIISSRSNEDIRILPAGTGGVVASAVRIAGTTISSDDSTQITLAENVQTTGTMTVAGALSSATSLTLASGATVTGILDEDNMATDSATQLATQQSIKAYVDSTVTAQDLDFACDDSTTLSIDLDSETLQFSGGTGITTAGTGNTVTFAIDSTVATLTGSQTLTNKILTNPTINAATMTGAVAIDGVTIDDNKVTSNASNANLELDASGTGQVRIIPNTTVVGTLNTADITTTGTQTITGTLNVDGVQIKDNKVTSSQSNSNLEISANGSGVVDVQNAMTTVAQTVTGNVAITGRADVDNIRMDTNTISTTNSNGGLTISPNGTGAITLDAGTISVPGVMAIGSALIDNTLFMETGSKIQANVTNEDVYIESNGTGSVVIDQVSITDNKITTHVSNADLEIDTDGTGTIELQTATNVTGNLTVSGAFTGSRQTISGAGVINLTTLFTEITTTGADAYSLANGTVGQIKIITMAVNGGDATITPTTFANGTSMTMDAVHDSVTLIYGANGWVVLASQNVTINA